MNARPYFHADTRHRDTLDFATPSPGVEHVTCWTDERGFARWTSVITDFTSQEQ
jgi:hypothetical protein